ncbi:MAG TPA: mannosyl-3-phosphoglycerate phosphatase [Dehalococcoidia bacterium]|nr:mannosyl-3-phosphoglycerate phosphatase [Dehalococcoidia bacterium]
MNRGVDWQGVEEKMVIFTDLDGTLLDYYTYSCDVVRPLINKLKKAGVEIVPCSSKTRAEIEFYRWQLGLDAPFIAENGGAIFIGRDYFKFVYEYQRQAGEYNVIELGMLYNNIRRKLDAARQENGLDFKGFGDMSEAEVATLTGLDMASAGRARQREYSETLDIIGSEVELKHTLDCLKAAGLDWSRGSRLFCVAVGSDKGVAVEVLANLYKQKWGSIKTIGVGDSPNDEPMLAVVDFPILVQKPPGYWENIKLPNLYKVNGIGPDGWVKAIEELTDTR